ncbi:diaminopimelate decarboxylase [Salinicola avicenniae]|uniref:diaminopimelate decarboxylase n=1 Tax=Salinicola avicenniae TaxID=2916836 RepID=UPI00207491BC|nr:MULTISPECIES: diaminopimelate decarboxylase [unclassified Salinicola]
MHAENLPLTAIAEQFGTPCYVYSRAALTQQFQAYSDALGDMPHLVCYALKTNSNLAVIDLLARLGAGFDIVSVGELERVIAAGGDPAKVVFSGVAKQADEMARALAVGIKCFNVESRSELERLDRVATARGQIANVSIRVNPDVDAKTHPYISTGLKANKFGVAADEVFDFYAWAAERPYLKVVGLDCHIGSQLTELSPYLDALDRLLLLVDRLADHGIAIEHLDLGGGLGVTYQDERPPAAGELVAAVRERLAGRQLTLLLEPGRSIAANAGVLLTRVEYLKPGETKNFAIVDAGMNDLIRPSLYQAWQGIDRVDSRAERPSALYDVVGPICESGDFLGQARELAIAEGDLLAVRSAGAYGFAMASNYNSRGRPAEVMVDADRAHLIRRRESVESLWALESRLPESD